MIRLKGFIQGEVVMGKIQDAGQLIMAQCVDILQSTITYSSVLYTPRTLKSMQGCIYLYVFPDPLISSWCLCLALFVLKHRPEILKVYNHVEYNGVSLEEPSVSAAIQWFQLSTSGFSHWSEGVTRNNVRVLPPRGLCLGLPHSDYWMKQKI